MHLLFQNLKLKLAVASAAKSVKVLTYYFLKKKIFNIPKITNWASIHPKHFLICKIIVASVNEAAQPWGVQCMRYEIKDIQHYCIN